MVTKEAAIIPRGAHHFPVESEEGPKRFGFLLLDQFTLLAFSSAMEPLRIANQLSQQPLYAWDLFSEDGGPVLSSSGVEVSAGALPAEISRDVNLFVCSGATETALASAQTQAFLRRHHRMGGTLGGICTGAMTLASAGLLKGRAFTMHWENHPSFCEMFPDLTPTERVFENDGRVLTCGGGAGATEMILAVIARDYGEGLALTISDMCLRGRGLEPAPQQRSSLATTMLTRHPKILRIVEIMIANCEDPVPLQDLAEEVGLSRRQMERQFKAKLGVSPAEYYRNIRLDRARNLLSETNLNVRDVAIACGFNTMTSFRRTYVARFGVLPSLRR